MKINIFGVEKTVEPEKEVWLKLNQYGADVMLIACDKTGERYRQGNILTITTSGVRLETEFNQELGIETKDNRIRVY